MTLALATIIFFLLKKKNYISVLAIHINTHKPLFKGLPCFQKLK